jgi:hypothetical protein
MTIKPIITLILSDGTKKRFEAYNRPPMLYINAELVGGGAHSIPFERTGPDEYTQVDKEISEEND